MTFELAPWFDHGDVLLGSSLSLSLSWFEAVGPIADTMGGDGVEQMVVDGLTEDGPAMRHQGDHWLKGFERLDRFFEADRAGLDPMLAGRLGDDGADEVIGQ